MLNVRVDMGKLHCGMQTQQWNNGIVKNVMQTLCTKMQQYSIMCIVFLSIFNVLTQSFSVLKIFAKKCKKIDIWQMNTATGLILQI